MPRYQAGRRQTLIDQHGTRIDSGIDTHEAFGIGDTPAAARRDYRQSGGIAYVPAIWDTEAERYLDAEEG